MNESEPKNVSRRRFVQTVGGAGLALGLAGAASRASAADVPRDASGKIIPGFEKNDSATPKTAKGWQPVSDRKVRVGLVQDK